MLSIGWTEMMLVAAVALIVVGPKDLPGMLRQIGKAVGSVRRMGNDFKAELNKVTAVDDLKDIKRSIAAPLTDVRRNIEKEFNSIAPSGKVIPSGVIAPADPDAQSVVNEIKSAAGIENKPVDPDAAKASIAAAVTKARDGAVNASNETKDVVAKEVVAKAPRKPRRTATKKPTAKKTPAKKPAAKKPAKSEEK